MLGLKLIQDSTQPWRCDNIGSVVGIFKQNITQFVYKLLYVLQEKIHSYYYSTAWVYIVMGFLLGVLLITWYVIFPSGNFMRDSYPKLIKIHAHIRDTFARPGYLYLTKYSRKLYNLKSNLTCLIHLFSGISKSRMSFKTIKTMKLTGTWLAKVYQILTVR